MLDRIKNLLLGRRVYDAVFIRAVIIQSNTGTFQLWQKRPVVYRKRWTRKRSAGGIFWELQNTINQPLFGHSDESSPLGALKEILKSHGRRFFISYEPNEGTSSIIFTDV